MLLPLLLGTGLAHGAPTVTIDATVDDDLRTLRGTVTLTDLDDASLVDPLAALPIPADETARVRTWPGRPERGRVVWERHGDVVTFETTLPRRWEDTGSTRRHGLFANGGWYPQPLVDGDVPSVRFDVHVALPDGVTGALGDTVDAHDLRWSAHSDRASLAVVPGGEVTVLEGESWRIELLTRRHPRRGLLRGLREALPLTQVSGRRWTGVAVEAPLRRRLSRPGVGLGYVSDRAFRVTPIVRYLQTAGAVKGLVASWTGSDDAWTREIAAAALRRLADDRVERQARADLVGLTKWIPMVDAALYSWEMDFRADLFDEWVPSDRVADDLEERLDPHSPGSLVVAQVEERFGHDAVDALAEGLAMGWTLEDAERRLGLPTGFFAGWRTTYPPRQDYTVSLDGTVLTVERDVPEQAPEEAVSVDVDGRTLQWVAPGGPSTATWVLDEHPRHVALDPRRQLDQISREHDRIPANVRWTLWGRLWAIGQPPRYLSFMGALTVREASDTHNAVRIWAWTTQRAYLGGRLSWTHYEGKVTRPSVREHAVSVGFEGSWLDPAYGALAADSTYTSHADYTLGASLAYSWDNRRSILFPRDGAAVSASVQAGGAPQTGQDYVRLQAGFQGDRSVGPRHVLSARLQAGVAFSPILQEQLDLGGLDGVRGVIDQRVPTTAQGILSMEYRPVIVEDAWWSVGGLMWIRDLYLITGMDLAVGASQDQTVGVVGGVAGLGGTVELAGISPGALNLFVAWPAWWTGFDTHPGAVSPIRVYATWGVNF